MSILEQNEEIKVFPCPSCRKAISSKASQCKYCETPISDDVKTAAIEAEEKENRRIDAEFHRNIMLIGIAITFVGAGLLGISILNVYSGRGGFFIWSPIITLVGIGQVIYGLVGMRKANRRK